MVIMKLVSSGKRMPISQNNRWLAEKQLHQLNDKLSNNPELKQKYEETLEKDLQNGYVRKINQTKKNQMKKLQSLFNTSSLMRRNLEKVRRFANTSSVFQGQSLNSNLLKGPDLLSNIIGVFLRILENKTALSADIEQMFMQVKVAPEDRKFLRFLWNKDGRVETYEYTSHIFGTTDSPCIASYALRKTARDKEEGVFLMLSNMQNATFTWMISMFSQIRSKVLKITAMIEKSSL